MDDNRSHDIRIYLSDLRTIESNMDALGTYTNTQYSSINTSITNKKTEVTNGKNTIVNKMVNNCYVPAGNINKNNNSYYEWSEIAGGVKLCYDKGYEKGAGCIAEAVQSKGIYENISSGSGNRDQTTTWTNNKGCACYVEASCECGARNEFAEAGLYNASGSIIKYMRDDEDGDLWSESYSRAQAAVSSGAVAALWSKSISGGTIYMYKQGGKHGGNHYQSASVKGIVPAGGRVYLYTTGAAGGDSTGQSDWSIVAVPLGYN